MSLVACWMRQGLREMLFLLVGESGDAVMKYREMHQHDVEQTFAVRISTRENRMSMESLAALGTTPESVSRALRKNTSGWICEDAGKILGFAMGNGATGEMQVIAVLPTHEGRGIGRHLMGLVLERPSRAVVARRTGSRHSGLCFLSPSGLVSDRRVPRRGTDSKVTQGSTRRFQRSRASRAAEQL